MATTHDLEQADAALTWLLASGRRFDDAEISRAFGAMPGLVVDDPDSSRAPCCWYWSIRAPASAASSNAFAISRNAWCAKFRAATDPVP